MTRATKILLGISLSAFAFGFTNILWGLGRPVGAICFGLFMISKVLEKEMALFDEEQRRNPAPARAQETSAKNKSLCAEGTGTAQRPWLPFEPDRPT
jgi:hypothetical protein